MIDPFREFYERVKIGAGVIALAALYCAIISALCWILIAINDRWIAPANANDRSFAPMSARSITGSYLARRFFALVPPAAPETRRGGLTILASDDSRSDSADVAAAGGRSFLTFKTRRYS